MLTTVSPSARTSWRIRSCAPPGSTTIARLVIGSPRIEQLQLSGGTGNVLRIIAAPSYRSDAPLASNLDPIFVTGYSLLGASVAIPVEPGDQQRVNPRGAQDLAAS